jgi:hypothetical protein
MRTLLYLASGAYREAFQDLPFDRMIFVDRCQGYAQNYPKNDSRIRFIPTDALIAIDMLKQEGVKIDCLVSVNEGLEEGGGTYPIFSGFLMGYLSPLLKDEFTLVCDLNYYVSKLRTPMSKLDWGFNKTKLIPGNIGYVNPALFTDSAYRYSKENYGNVYLMQRCRSEITLNLPNSKTQVKVIHGSIWEDEDKLDLIGLNLLSKHSLDVKYRNTIHSVDTFFEAKPKVLNINGQTFETILDYCKTNDYKRIGLTPWLKGNYQELIQCLKKLDNDFFQSIIFYHLNKNDFQSLREF